MTSPRDLIERRLEQIKRQRDIHRARHAEDPDRIEPNTFDRQIAAWEIVLETFDKGIEAQKPRVLRVNLAHDFRPDMTTMLSVEAQAWVEVQRRLYAAGFDLTRIITQTVDPATDDMIFQQERVH